MADFYVRTAVSLDKVLSNISSVKASAAPHHDSKRVLALLVNTLAYRIPLSQVLEQVNVSQIERKVFPSSSKSGGNHSEADEDAKAKRQNGKGMNSVQDGKTSRAKPPSPSKPSTTSLLLVLAHDLLFSARGIQAAKSWPPKLAIERHRARLHSELVKLQLRAGKSRIQELRAGANVNAQDGRPFDEIVRSIPRWARVNELKTDVEYVKTWLAERGWKQVGQDGSRTELKASNEFAVSNYVPSLLAFPPKSTSTLLASELYKDGFLVLQDLASCMPAQILDPLTWGAKASGPSESKAGQKRSRTASDERLAAIDATSAPGNKTSHLSALMQGRGHLAAFERSETRYKTLTKLLGRSGAIASSTSSAKAKKAKALGNVTTFNEDFLQTDPENQSWKGVHYMLVDPSCSGSGIVNRLDYLKTDNDGDENDEADEADEALDALTPDQKTATKGTSSKGVLAAHDKKRKRSTDPPVKATEDVDGFDAEADEAQQQRSRKQQRLEKLAEFQLLMIRHAMRFPALHRLVYSTCSIHATENEHVVLRALQSPEAIRSEWKLAPRSQVLPDWPVRGHVEECCGDCVVADSMIRCIPGGTPFAEGKYPNTESCNGFFVACFIRGSATVEEEGQRGGSGEGDKTEVGTESNAKDAQAIDEDEQERRKRRKTEQNRKKAEQKKRRDKERKQEAAALVPGTS